MAKPSRGSGEDADSNRKAGASKGEEVQKRRSGLSSNLETITGAIALAFFIRIAIFEAFEIEGPSMEPTLFNGDRVVVAKFRYGLFLPFATEATLQWSAPQIGQVIIVKSPEGVDIVKRVIGLPGDLIEIRDDVVYRNEIAVTRTTIGACTPGSQLNPTETCTWHRESAAGLDWRTSKDGDAPPQSNPPVVVPEGHVFVLGDHRDRSNDSRFFGTVNTNRIKGQALMIYWSSANGWWWDQEYVFRPGRIFNVVR